MNLPDIDPIAGNLSQQIEQAAEVAYTELLRLIEGGMDAREAVRVVLESFNGQYVTALTEAFSTVMQTAILPPLVLTMPVGGVHLSKKLYTHLRQTQNEVEAIVKQHAQGLHDARKLARQLYDGYTPQDGIKRPLEGPARAYLPKALRELTKNPGPRQDLTLLLEQMQQQAARNKSPTLQAAYLELLEAWAKGKGKDELAKRLWVAQREKTRYMADRIAQTELGRAYTDRVSHEIMQDDEIEVVQLRLNPRHPKPDICDLHARADLWGLGPGIYPKAKAPKPSFHPHCWCKLVTRPDLTAAKAKERQDGARAWLRTLPPAEAARVLGSRERLDAVLNGGDWEAVTQANVRQEYRLSRLGDGAQSRPMRLSESEKKEYADWAALVLSDGYLARHEFRKIGLLPQKVLNDPDVMQIGVEGAVIETSDYLLRHGNRNSKEERGASLRPEDLTYLPDRLEAATWVFDPKHGNVIAFFDIDDQVMVGKAVVHFKYMRKGKGHNAVITTGIVKRTNIRDGGKREI